MYNFLANKTINNKLSGDEGNIVWTEWVDPKIESLGTLSKDDERRRRGRTGSNFERKHVSTHVMFCPRLRHSSSTQRRERGKACFDVLCRTQVFFLIFLLLLHVLSCKNHVIMDLNFLCERLCRLWVLNWSRHPMFSHLFRKVWWRVKLPLQGKVYNLLLACTLGSVNWIKSGFYPSVYRCFQSFINQIFLDYLTFMCVCKNSAKPYLKGSKNICRFIDLY